MLVYSILNKSGAITGYAVGDYFLTIEEARFFIKNLGDSKQVYGERQGEFVISRSSNVLAKVSAINVISYNDFVSQCCESGAVLCDVVFVPCKYTDFDWWRHNDMWKLPGCFCYKCMSGPELLGYLLLNTRLYTSKSLFIAMIETVRHRCGYGSRIIESLKAQGIRLSGLSTVDAKSFWIKHGAIFRDGNRFRI